MSWIKTEDEIEEWYFDQRRRLDEVLQNALQANVGDERAKARFLRDLHTTRDTYERMYVRFRRWQQFRRALLRSIPMRMYQRARSSLKTMRERFKGEE